MFKIRKFIHLSQSLFTKLRISNVKPKFPSFKPILTSILILLPTTYWFSINTLSLDLENQNINSISNTRLFLAERLSSKFTGKEEEHLNDLMSQISIAIRDENFHEAKIILGKAIQESDANNFHEKLAHLCNLLCAIVIREGSMLEAEEILVRFIEKLAEIGFKETDNEVIRCILILSRMYQFIGNTEMAEIGFRSCIQSQENKFKNNVSSDDTTQILYLNVIFWYSIFLSEGNRLGEAKFYMEQALYLTESNPYVKDSQKMVVLHHLAELSCSLKEFDSAVTYLVKGLRLCFQSISLNYAIPIFLARLGLVFLGKEMYDKSQYWCNIAYKFAKASNNQHVKDEAILCLRELKKNKQPQK